MGGLGISVVTVPCGCSHCVVLCWLTPWDLEEPCEHDGMSSSISRAPAAQSPSSVQHKQCGKINTGL